MKKLKTKKNLKAGDTGCYHNPGMEHGTYWCYATEPGEAVSCDSTKHTVISVCASGDSRSCMDNGNRAATRIQCKDS